MQKWEHGQSQSPLLQEFPKMTALTGSWVVTLTVSLVMNSLVHVPLRKSRYIATTLGCQGIVNGIIGDILDTVNLFIPVPEHV